MGEKCLIYQSLQLELIFRWRTNRIWWWLAIEKKIIKIRTKFIYELVMASEEICNLL